jgi:transcriptional regulator with XRE-family HTH domain
MSEIVTITKAAERQQRLVDLIIDERKTRKIRQQELARKLRQHQSWVSRMEGGERRIDVLEFLALAEAIGFDPGAALRKIQAAEDCNTLLITEALAAVRAAGYRVSKPKIKVTAPLGLNAVGKPYSPQYDPKYRMRYRPSFGHLRFPYPSTMRFVGDPVDGEPKPIAPKPKDEKAGRGETESADARPMGAKQHE